MAPAAAALVYAAVTMLLFLLLVLPLNGMATWLLAHALNLPELR